MSSFFHSGLGTSPTSMSGGGLGFWRIEAVRWFRLHFISYICKRKTVVSIIKNHGAPGSIITKRVTFISSLILLRKK